MLTTSFENQTAQAVRNYYQRLIEAVGHQRLDELESLLATEGTSVRELLDEQQAQSFTDFSRILYLVQDKLQPDIILKFSKKIRLMDFGIMGYAVANSETLGQALELVRRFSQLAYVNFDFDISIQNSLALIIPTNFQNSTPIEREDFTIAKKQHIEMLLPAEISLKDMRIHFDYPEPEYVNTYREVFGCELIFNSELLRLEFPADWLEIPVASADHVLYELCEAQCEEMLNERGKVADIVDKIRRLLLRPRGLTMRLEDAAEKLFMSPRTLREHIYQGGTTYKEIVKEIRMSLARKYLLSSRLSVKEISYMLDYSQPNAFCRAFKTYFGKTPESMRSEMSR